MTSTSLDTSLILTAAGTVAAFIAIWQTYRANRLAAAAARENTADLELTLFGQPQTNEFALALPLNVGSVQLPLTLHLGNKGEKTVRDIEIILRFPRHVIYGAGRARTDTMSSHHDVSVKTIAQTDEIETVLVTLPALNPGIIIPLEFMITITEQSRLRSGDVADARNDPNVEHKCDAGSLVEIVVACADTPIAVARYSILVIDTSRQAVMPFFERMHHKTRGFRRDKRAVPVAVIEIAAEHVIASEYLPVHEVRYRAPVKIYKGLHFSSGYWIPSAGVQLPLR
jgi:hypothetical protein